MSIPLPRLREVRLTQALTGYPERVMKSAQTSIAIHPLENLSRVFLDLEPERGGKLKWNWRKKSNPPTSQQVVDATAKNVMESEKEATLIGNNLVINTRTYEALGGD